ncbi:helix-turn-helix transcriptional regulator [Vitellibacter sp. q18]|jgi:AraC-like DNA-binding protein|nr:helix-turn-helix transcriptional regulator [Aequorivita lutea]
MDIDLPDPKAYGHGSAMRFQFTNSPEPFRTYPFTFQEFYLEKQVVHKIMFFPTECFYLIYCWSGTVCCLLGEKNRRLHHQESCIVYDSEGKGVRIAMDKQPAQVLIIAFSNFGKVLMEGVPCFFNRYKNIFKENLPDQYYYVGRIDLALFSKIDFLRITGKRELEKLFLWEGIFYQLFGLKLLQLIREKKEGNLNLSGFSPWEMEQIRLVSEEIIENPGREYSIESLCKKSGLGPNKLQKGFREMFGRSVINYIRDIRLEKSVELLRNSNFTISEIVYDIGLKNRSYFSKIFKQKYRLSPKDFQKTQRQNPNI